jgi:hypothetical protein
VVVDGRRWKGEKEDGRDEFWGENQTGSGRSSWAANSGGRGQWRWVSFEGILKFWDEFYENGGKKRCRCIFYISSRYFHFVFLIK